MSLIREAAGHMSFPNMKEKIAQYMREDLAGEGEILSDDMTIDEKALFYLMCTSFHAPVSREELMAVFEKEHGKKFDVASLLGRLEVLYADAIAGKAVVKYDGGLSELRRDMDRLYERSRL